jgi:hypothetical protein
VALAGASRSQRAVARIVRRTGGTVTGALPAPSVVLARIPASSFETIEDSELVQAVEVGGARKYAGVAGISGADVWHAAGCSGAGTVDGPTCPTTSAPQSVTGPTNGTGGQGGPDLAVDDQGINDHHWAFTGGPTPALGRSPATVRPQGAADLNGADPGTTNGSLHGNTIAAIVATKQPAYRGVAYGIDKILDPNASGVAPNMWLLGLTFNGKPGTTDLPEAWNKSYGILATGVNFHTIDDYAYTREADMEASQYGIAQAIAAGNDGPYPPLGGALRPYNNPGGVGNQARVAHPCVAFNALCVGAVHNTIDTNHANDVVEDYSSRGPSVGGRKKPDLVAFSGGSWGCPYGGYVTYNPNLDDMSTDPRHGWRGGSICGEGTSYAAPFGAGAQLLLAGVGITSPMAQKAILINSAYAIDSEIDADSLPQEYWAPDVGWGELDLGQAYADRGNYRLSTVGPAPTNNARFFRVNGQTAGDRTTLAWHRRAVVTDYSDLETLGYTTTDLDLYQLTLAGADNDKDVCGASSTCGVDLSEDTDTGPTVVTGGVVTKWNATDSATDTVEQVRAKVAGDSIIKVEASSTIDGAATEDFALASTEALTPLSTPTLSAPAASLSATQAQVGQSVTVTANFTNQSTGADLVQGLDLLSGEATINLPAGVTCVSCASQDAAGRTQAVGGIATGQTKNATWTVQATSSGVHGVTFTARGQRFGTTFETTASASSLTADSDPPAVALSAPSGWQGQKTNMVSWNVTDALTSVATVEVEASVAGGPFQSVYSGGSASGSASVTADDGQSVTVRVRASDALSNQSAYSTGTWQVDADPPSLSVSAPATVYYGDGASVVVATANVGSATTTSYRIGGGGFAPLIGTTFTIPAVRGSTSAEVRVTDELGRVVTRSVTVKSRPRPTTLAASVKKRAGKSRLNLRVTPAVSGSANVRITCGKKRRSVRAKVRAGKGVARLPRGLGKCTLRMSFRASSASAYAASSKRITARL